MPGFRPLGFESKDIGRKKNSCILKAVKNGYTNSIDDPMRNWVRVTFRIGPGSKSAGFSNKKCSLPSEEQFVAKDWQ